MRTRAWKVGRVVVALLALAVLPWGAARAAGYLGIEFDGAAEERGEGIRVTAVTQGGAAAAGIQAGDVVVEFAGRPIAGFAPLREALQGMEVGARVPVKVRRGEADLALTVTLGAPPSGARSSPAPAAPPPTQEDLGARRQEKLSEPWFASRGWLTDLHAARARSAAEGKPIFAYFTRSYAG
ncbi:MAG: PDZ domain-containing protein [Planctomycetes bacterium]|nr:PDZ domain-containing protein [Planctomycetota bacterium]